MVFLKDFAAPHAWFNFDWITDVSNNEYIFFHFKVIQANIVKGSGYTFVTQRYTENWILNIRAQTNTAVLVFSKVK